MGTLLLLIYGAADEGPSPVELRSARSLVIADSQTLIERPNIFLLITIADAASLVQGL